MLQPDLTKVPSTTPSSSHKPTHYRYRSIPDGPNALQAIICNIRDAIVSVSSQQSLSPLDNRHLTIKTGNGFFIKGHYIICPASLVLMPPTTFLTPSMSKRSAKKLAKRADKEKVSTCQDTPQRQVNRILVDVSNVNGAGISYSYESSLLGVDGAANIAILTIDMSLEWNQTNPPIQPCHPFLPWGKSRNLCPGEQVMLIGDVSSPDSIGFGRSLYAGVSENGVVLGNIADNRYISYGGTVPGELLLLSNMLLMGSQQGLPVITKEGMVVGMFLHVESDMIYNIALSEFFMRRPVKGLIRSFMDNCVPKNYSSFITPVINQMGKYYSFTKSCLGISGIAMNQNDFNTVIVLHEKSISREAMPKSGKSEDKSEEGSSDLSGGSSSSENRQRGKEIVGYRILSLNNSLLQQTLTVGDIITHINQCPLGDRKGQISPALLMWRVSPGDKVILRYKKQSERFLMVHETTACTLPYYLSFDFPWYAVRKSAPGTIWDKSTTMPILL